MVLPVLLLGSPVAADTRSRSEGDDFLQAIKRDGGLLDGIGSPPFKFFAEAGYFGNLKVRA